MAEKNHPNFLKRVIAIQDVTMKYKQIGLSQVEIFKRHIEPHWSISKSTYDRYLALPAKRILKQKQDD